MGSLKTCPDFVEHPHIVEYKMYSPNGEFRGIDKSGCYECRSASASEGINPIADALEILGISNEIHQTGGFCMCIHIDMGGTSFIYVNEEGFSYYKDQEDEGIDYREFDPNQTDPQIRAQLIADWIKENKK
jgi:hypothetical protein